MNDVNGKLTVCERDYWIYQRKHTMFPWAIRATKRYEKGKRRTFYVEFDFTLNIETIPNATHSVTVENVHYDSIEGYVSFLKNIMREYTDISTEDKEQLYSAILNALMD